MDLWAHICLSEILVGEQLIQICEGSVDAVLPDWAVDLPIFFGAAEPDIGVAFLDDALQYFQRLMQVPDVAGPHWIPRQLRCQLPVLLGGAANDVRHNRDGLGAAVHDALGPIVKAVDVIGVFMNRLTGAVCGESAVVQEEHLVVTDQLDGAVDLLVADLLLTRAGVVIRREEATADQAVDGRLVSFWIDAAYR